MVAIVPYEQQQTPQSSEMPTRARAPGAQTAAAIGSLGKSISTYASQMDEVNDRKAQVEAASILTKAALVTQKMMETADALGETDPTGYAGKFNEVFSTSRNEIMSSLDKKTASNPYLQGHLKAGFEKLQQTTFLRAMQVEHEATGKYAVKQLGDIATVSAKIVMNDPSRFEEQRDRVMTAADTNVGIPALARAEFKTRAADSLAMSAIGKVIDDDPKKAREMLADEKNQLVVAMSADTFQKAKDQADKMYWVKEGESQGNAIGLKATSLSAITGQLEKITDENVRKYAEQAAYQTYGQKEQAKKEYDRNLYDSAIDYVWANPNAEWTPPRDMKPEDILRVRQFKTDAQYNAQGFGTKTDIPTYVMLHDMMVRDPAGFAKLNIKQYYPMLSGADAKTLEVKRSDIQSGRSTVADIQKDGLIDNAIKQVFPPVGKAASQNAKQERALQEQSFKYSVLSRVNYMEENVWKRQGTPAEIQGVVDEATRYRNQTGPAAWDKYGLVSGGATQTVVEAVPGQYTGIIANTLKMAGRDPSPAAVTGMYNAIHAQEDQLKDALESQGLEPTEANMVAEFLRQGQ